MKHRYGDSLQACFLALSVRSYGHFWSTACEAAAWLSQAAENAQPMLDLCIFCADRAIALGVPRSVYATNAMATLQSALYYKAGALTWRGQHVEALGALDHARLLGENERVDKLHVEVLQLAGLLG